MAGETTPSVLSGFLKPVFGELQLLVPEEATLQKMFKFDNGNLVGDHFEEPMQVKTSWGVSFCGSAGGVTALNAPINSETQPAKITPFLTVLRDQVSYSMFDRAPEGSSAKQAFMATATYVGKNLAMQLRRLLEISMLCGQEGLFAIDTIPDATSFTVTAATKASGILSILEGALLHIFTSTGLTKRFYTGSTQAMLKVEAVNVDTGTVTVSTDGVDGQTGDLTNVVAGDLVYLYLANASSAGTGSFNEMVGLRKQIGAQTGTVFNIAKQTYSLWRGSTHSSIGTFSAGALLKGATKAINRGFQGTMVALLPPDAWNILNSNVIGQQMFDSSYSVSKAKEGSDAIEIRGNGVTIECVAHAYVRAGEYMLVPKEYVKRIGSVDVTFNIPGAEAKYLLPVIGSTAVEMQCRSDQQIYLQRPAWSVLGTGITYS